MLKAGLCKVMVVCSELLVDACFFLDLRTSETATCGQGAVCDGTCVMQICMVAVASSSEKVACFFGKEHL